MWVLTDAREYSIVQVPYLESDRLHSTGLLVYVLKRFCEELPVILSSFRLKTSKIISTGLTGNCFKAVRLL